MCQSVSWLPNLANVLSAKACLISAHTTGVGEVCSVRFGTCNFPF